MIKIITGCGLAVILSACAATYSPIVPTPGDGTPTTTVESTTTTTVPPPMTDETDVFGNSIGALTVSTGITDGDGRVWNVASGATVGYWRAQIDDSIGRRVDHVVLALAANEAGPWTGGWDDVDVAQYSMTLQNADPRTCVVLVLPWVTDALEATYPGSRAEADEARAWLSSQVSRPNTIVADWGLYVQANPAIIGPDGLHIVAWGYEPSNPAAYAYWSMIVEAEERCS